MKARVGLLTLIFPESFLIAPCLVEIRYRGSIIFKQPVIGTKLELQVKEGTYNSKITYAGWIFERVLDCYPNKVLIVPEVINEHMPYTGLRGHMWNVAKRNTLIAEYENIHFISTPPFISMWGGVRSVDSPR